MIATNSLRLSLLLAVSFVHKLLWLTITPEFALLSSSHSIMYDVNKTIDIVEFLRETYIEKIKGNWDNKRKLFHFECFKEDWQLFHLHHVCIKGGYDGVVVGIEGIDNDWRHRVGQNPHIISADEWNKHTELNTKFHPLRVHRLQENDSVVDIRVMNGSSLYMNCYQQPADSMNPAHWLMKLGTLYELASCAVRNKQIGSFNDMFKNQWILPISQFYLHQCPNPFLTDWKWGENILTIIRDQVDQASIFSKDNPRFFNDDGYLKHNKSKPFYKLTCFEDVYLSQRTGIWMQKSPNLLEFRKDSAKIIGEPAEALTIPEKLEDFHEYGTPMRNQPYCHNPGTGRPFPRIRVFQRSGTKSLRKFVNLPEVIQLLQEFSDRPVVVITANATTSIAEQIRLFNQFDVLVTPHGSHLANGIFTMRPGGKAVVEVVPYAFDKVFYSNYNSHLEFGHYMFSTGHLTPQQEATNGTHCYFSSPERFQHLNASCSITRHSVPHKVDHHFLVCNNIFQPRMCDTWVNVTILRNSMLELFNHTLCRLSSSPVFAESNIPSTTTSSIPIV